MDKLEKAKKERTKVSDGQMSWMQGEVFRVCGSCWRSPTGSRLLSGPAPTPVHCLVVLRALGVGCLVEGQALLAFQPVSA